MAPRNTPSRATPARKPQQTPVRPNPNKRSQRGKADEQAPQPSPSTENDDCVVCGIDFGATYSAVAYTPASKKAFLNRYLVPLRADEIGMVRYDDCLHSDDKEVPSQMKYDEGKGGQGPVKWGYTVENDRTWKNNPTSWKKLLYPKLLLSSKAETERFLQDARDLGKAIEKDAESIVADFLQKLIAKLNAALRSKFPRFENAERFYFCGYPPAWPERDVLKLTKACEQAGMRTIQMVSEPTAAATALLEGMSPTTLSSNGLGEGETFLLIDAGGMTVEFTVLKILSVSPIAVEQLTVGNGDYCGSGYCNLRFRNWVMRHERFRDLLYKDRRRLADIADHAANVEFEFLVKRKLKPDDDPQEKSHINLPAHLIPYLDDWRADENDPTSVAHGWKKVPEFVLTREEVGKFMERSFQDITRLALEEIRIAENMGINTSKVVLTGGFGRNILLQHRIKEALKQQDKHAEVIQPDQQSGAVAHGIVHMAMNQSAVKKSRMRYSLGIDEKQDHDPKVHKEDVVSWPATPDRHIVESIHWLLKKGAEIEFNRPLICPREIEIGLDSKDEWRLTTEIITSSITSEDNLDRLGEHTGRPSNKPSEVYHEIRSDCHNDNILVVDLRNLSESDKRAYLGLRSGKKRRGTFKFNIEYVVHHDNRLDFWMVPTRGPSNRWKMVPDVSDSEEHGADYVDLGEHGQFRQDELTFPSPSKESKITDGLRKMSISRTLGTQDNQIPTKRLTRPGRRTRPRSQQASRSGDIFTFPCSPPPEDPTSSSTKKDAPYPTTTVTPCKRGAEVTGDEEGMQRSKGSYNPRRSLRTPASRSPTPRAPTTDVEDVHDALQDFHPADGLSAPTNTEEPAFEVTSTAPKKLKITAQRSHASSGSAVGSSSSSRQPQGSPPHRPTPTIDDFSTRSSPEIPSSNINPSQASSIARWTHDRPKRSVRQVNYRIKGLDELEASD